MALGTGNRRLVSPREGISRGPSKAEHRDYESDQASKGSVKQGLDSLYIETLTIPDVIEIQFSKSHFKYNPGQWLFLQMPSISKYQWHPFTITSCPFDPYVSVHIRLIGDFTRALGDAVGAGPAQAKLYEEASSDPMTIYEVALQNGEHMPPLRTDGPYGAPAEDVFDNEIAILIGAGIGVTPWASILKNIWHLRNKGEGLKHLRRV